MPLAFGCAYLMKKGVNLLNLIKGFFPALLGLGIQMLMMIVSVSPINIRHWKVGYKTLAIALIMMFAYGGFTVAATHDYLSWNRVRWQALHHLMQEDQISPSHIGGGFEFNGWYLYDDDYDDWKYEPDKSWY